MAADDELDELLELADGGRPLPGDLEERLLADILQTAYGSDRTASAAPPADGSDDGVSDDAGVVVALERAAETGRRPRGRWILAAAAAVLVIALAAVAVLTADDTDDDITAGETDGDGTDPSPVPATTAEPLADLDDDRVCAALADALEDAGLVGPTVIVADIPTTQIARVGTLAAEYRSRVVEPETAESLVDLEILVENVVLERRGGTPGSAGAAHEAAAAAAAELLDALPDDHCLR